ncbi:MAG TPA: hypothetical protein VG674_12680 [Amycolatopsis sp.]|nr:hypothetical protein [Amycolatopsis sp.]
MSNDNSSATSRDIEFTADGVTLRGWLRLPAARARTRWSFSDTDWVD